MGICGGKDSKNYTRGTNEGFYEISQIPGQSEQYEVYVSVDKLNNTDAVLTDSKRKSGLAQKNTIMISKKQNYNGNPLEHHLACLKSDQDGNYYDLQIGVPVRSTNKFSIEIKGSCQKLYKK
ncbi:unnamed protein product [Paramecium octaurelia]|uniref:Uncharacterized protein n=1 Tax=Paramecium octaurelia TaxID=43137 RepID=A0A8S1UXE2_PAROT|nr:unnamed protein product [Paramecium octaurelia]